MAANGTCRQPAAGAVAARGAAAARQQSGKGWRRLLKCGCVPHNNEIAAGAGEGHIEAARVCSDENTCMPACREAE